MKENQKFCSRYFSASADQRPLFFFTSSSKTAKRASVFPKASKSAMAVKGQIDVGVNQLFAAGDVGRPRVVSMVASDRRCG